MPTIVDLTGGPAKDDLLRALMNPQGGFTTTFETPQGAIEASIERLEENGADGVTFLLWGRLTSTQLRSAAFAASYDTETRNGRLALAKAA
jgi:hypothetical protein